MENIGADHTARLHSLIYTFSVSYMLETGIFMDQLFIATPLP